MTDMIKKLNKLFSSVKLTIFLFFSLSVTSILGTIIQQGLAIERYKALYSSGVFSVLKFFDIFDMYHSWWFTTLLVLLSINIIACTSRQTLRITKLICPAKKEIDHTVFRSSQIRKTFQSQKKLSDIERQAEILIKSLVENPVKTVKNDTIYFFAEKGKYSRLGMIFVHISVLLILAGGLIGNILGFNGQMNIVEGNRSDTVILFGGKGTEEIGFDVCCDDFTVEFYETGMPKEYKTDLTIIDDEKKAASGTIRVNHPFFYKGLKFCQATYGIAGVSDFLIGARNNKTRKTIVLKPDIMKKVPLPGSNASFAIAKFVSDHGGMGPAVLGVLIEPGKAHDIFWIFQNGGNINQQQRGGFTFTLKEFTKLYYTGIQVSKDPGVPLVWTGFGLIMIGFMLSLFFAHMRIWLRISGSQDGHEISIAASVSKSRKPFEEKLEKLTGKIAVE
jgi:cytochrome c biogenesis protein